MKTLHIPVPAPIERFITKFQKWLICIWCSLALAVITYRSYSFDMIDTLIQYSASFNAEGPQIKPEYENDSCLFLYSDNYWTKSEPTPVYLPRDYFLKDIMKTGSYSYYNGRVSMTIPAGLLSDIGYSRGVMCIGMLIHIVIYVVLPPIRELGTTFFLTRLFFEGFGDALVYPSIFTLISQWSQPKDRFFFTAIIVAGQFYGYAIGLVIFHYTYVANQTWLLGQWITALIHIIWIIPGFLIIRHSPPKDPGDSDSPTKKKQTLQNRLETLQAIPWKEIVFSLPVLSLTLAYCSVSWLGILNVFLGPYENFQKGVLYLPEGFSGRSSFMVIVVVFSAIISGVFADWVVKKDHLSKKTTIRVLASVGVIPGVLLQVLAAIVGSHPACSATLYWIFFIVAAYLLGFALPVVLSNIVDLSPRHAGLLMGTMTAFNSVLIIFYERLDPLIKKEKYNAGQDRAVIFLYAILTLIFILPFLFFVSAEAQPWAFPKVKNPDENPQELDRTTSEPTQSV